MAIVSTPSYSHQIPYQPLWLELHARGHEIVLVTTNPMRNINSPNFTQIDISTNYNSLRAIDFVKLRFEKVDWIEALERYILSLCSSFEVQVFNSTEMKKMYAPDSNIKFDVLLTEFLYMPAIYAFAYRFNASLIGLSSLGLLSINDFVLGGAILPSHEYFWENEGNTGINLPFYKRLYNFVKIWRLLLHVNFNIFPEEQKLAEQYFGPLPPLIDIMKNVSMIFINEADVLTPGRPILPNIVRFSSFHVSENPDPLPKNLQKFLDGAKEGFIYFSLGSNARSSAIPKEIKRIFCNVFAKLPYRVIWKYEEEDLLEKPKNVYIGSWLPQQSILAHPKIKLFIYQGGVQSSEETIRFAVPVIGLPILADQDYQVRRMEALGIGKYLEITTLTEDQLENAIYEIINNKKYKERILIIRDQIKDTPYDTVKHLAWWTEYVVRTKGAPHLRCTLALEPWYQRFDMDIVVFLAIVTFIIVLSLFSIIVKLLVYLYKMSQISTDKKQKIT